MTSHQKRLPFKHGINYIYCRGCNNLTDKYDTLTMRGYVFEDGVNLQPLINQQFCFNCMRKMREVLKI